MDLSSLEGPPIQDTRFTSTASWRNNIPHISLEHVQGQGPFSPLSPLTPLETRRNLPPPRPASAGATSFSNRYPDTGSRGALWQSYRRSTGTVERLQYPSQSSSQTTTPQSYHAVFPPGPRHNHPYSSSLSTPHQLVWLESERIWVLTTTTTTTTTTTPIVTQRQPPQSLLSPMQARSHLRPGGMYPPMNHSVDMEPDDIPPPYEQHIYDQPLGLEQPVAIRLPPQNVPDEGGSRWAAVGRRINRTP